MTSSAMQAFERHVAAVSDGDLDAIVASYAPDAVLADTNRIGRGHEHIRAVHAEALQAAAELDPVMKVLEENGVIFVSWRAEPAGGPPLVGTNTFVISDGLITVNTAFEAANATSAGGLQDVSR
jgi:hypothetical protein